MLLIIYIHRSLYINTPEVFQYRNYNITNKLVLTKYVVNSAWSYLIRFIGWTTFLHRVLSGRVRRGSDWTTAHGSRSPGGGGWGSRCRGSVSPGLSVCLSTCVLNGLVHLCRYTSLVWNRYNLDLGWPLGSWCVVQPLLSHIYIYVY